MTDPPKGQPGLFRLSDLEAMELEEQPLFPSAEEDRPGLVSEVAAEEMVAAIRRARDLHSQEHEAEELSPEVSGIYSLLMDSATLQAFATPEPKEETGDHSAAHDVVAEPVLPNLSAREYRTEQSHAVIEAAKAERVKRSRGAVALMVGAPLALVAVTAAVVLTFLLAPEPLSEGEFPVRALDVTTTPNELAEVALMVVPVPEPEPEPEIAPEQPVRERRERRNREREPEVVIDRSDLF